MAPRQIFSSALPLLIVVLGCEGSAPATGTATDAKLASLASSLTSLGTRVSALESASTDGNPAGDPSHGKRPAHAQASPLAVTPVSHSGAGPAGGHGGGARPAAAAHAAPHWSYTDDIGPERWGTLSTEWATCGAGRSQSPIDIEPMRSRSSPIQFRYVPTTATVVDNGHTLQVDLAGGSSILVDDHEYALVQFHVHTPSEHSIAGDRYPLEVHLVHKDPAGKLAVVGVLYDVGAAAPALAPVWRAWPAKVGAPRDLGRPFDPEALLPVERSVFRYEGSLTTPPCTEGVSWNVMRHVRTESPEAIASLRKHYPMNARPGLPLGDREVH